jgi:hypothetical protein
MKSTCAFFHVCVAAIICESTAGSPPVKAPVKWLLRHFSGIITGVTGCYYLSPQLLRPGMPGIGIDLLDVDDAAQVHQKG